MSMHVTDSVSYLASTQSTLYPSTNSLQKRKFKKSEIGLIIAIVILGVAFITVSVWLGIEIAREKNVQPTAYCNVSEPQQDGNVCDTFECHKAAQTLLDFMDESVNPCEDFYNYACGRMPREGSHFHNIENRYAQLYTLKKKQLHYLRDFLERPWIQSKYPSSLQITKEFFDTCSHDAVDLMQLKTLLLDANLLDTSDESVLSFNWVELVASVIRKIGLDIIISVSVTPDESSDSPSYVLILNSPHLQAESKAFANNNSESEKMRELQKAYRNFMHDSSKLLGLSWSLQDVDDIIRFQTRLAEIVSAPWEMCIDNSKALTIAELPRMGKDGDWLTFFQMVLGDTDLHINENETLVIKDWKYYAGLSEVLDSFEVSVIKNYIAWQIIHTFAYWTSPAFRNILLTYMTVAFNVQELPEISEQCVIALTENMPFAMGRLYVDNFFNKEYVQKIEAITKEIKSAVKILIEIIDWMDEETKHYAFEKLNSMQLIVGYPPFIMNDEKMNQYHKEINLQNETLRSIISMRRLHSMKMFRKLHKPFNKDDDTWLPGPTSINIYYFPRRNILYVPSGIIQSPFYGSDRPLILNYAFIGSAIGHEIINSLVNSGSKFDKDGKIGRWWTNETMKRYTEKKECFIKQHMRFFTPLKDKELDAVLEANIADIGGLLASLKAFKIYLAKYEGLFNNDIVQGLKHLNSEQLFYLSFANMWCESANHDHVSFNAEVNNFSTGKSRVLSALTNLASFHKAFKCISETLSHLNKASCSLFQ